MLTRELLSIPIGPRSEELLNLYEEQFAQALASRGGLGLSRLIMQGLKARSQDDPAHTEVPSKSASKP